MTTYRVTLSREAKQTIEIEVEADSEEEARELAVEDPLDFPIVSEDIEGFHDFEIEGVVPA